VYGETAEITIQRGLKGREKFSHRLSRSLTGRSRGLVVVPGHRPPASALGLVYADPSGRVGEKLEAEGCWPAVI
jgi:hypothetical protein